MAHLRLDSIVLVVHDASGPSGIDFSVKSSQQRQQGSGGTAGVAVPAVEALVLLNTYYNWDTVFRKPEAIWLFSNPFTRRVAGWVGRHVPGVNTALFHWQVRNSGCVGGYLGWLVGDAASK